MADVDLTKLTPEQLQAYKSLMHRKQVVASRVGPDYTKEVTPEPPAKDAGYWPTIGHDLAGTIKSIPQIARHPFIAEQEFLDKQVETAEKSRQPGLSPRERAAYVGGGFLFGPGPLATQAGEEIHRGQTGQGYAHATEAILPFLFPRVLPGAARGAYRGAKTTPIEPIDFTKIRPRTLSNIGMGGAIGGGIGSWVDKKFPTLPGLGRDIGFGLGMRLGSYMPKVTGLIKGAVRGAWNPGDPIDFSPLKAPTVTEPKANTLAHLEDFLKNNQIDDAEFVRRASSELGYTPEKAQELLQRARIKHAQAEEFTPGEPKSKMSVNELMNSVVDGHLERDRFVEKLDEFGYTTEEKDLQLQKLDKRIADQIEKTKEEVGSTETGIKTGNLPVKQRVKKTSTSKKKAAPKATPTPEAAAEPVVAPPVAETPPGPVATPEEAAAQNQSAAPPVDAPEQTTEPGPVAAPEQAEQAEQAEAPPPEDKPSQQNPVEMLTEETGTDLTMGEKRHLTNHLAAHHGDELENYAAEPALLKHFQEKLGFKVPISKDAFNTALQYAKDKVIGPANTKLTNQIVEFVKRHREINPTKADQLAKDINEARAAKDMNRLRQIIKGNPLREKVSLDEPKSAETQIKEAQDEKARVKAYYQKLVTTEGGINKHLELFSKEKAAELKAEIDRILASTRGDVSGRVMRFLMGPKHQPPGGIPKD